MKGILGVALVVATFAGTQTRASESTPMLSLDLAKQMIAGCEAKAKSEGWKMNVSVVDAGANMVAFERMDGAFLGGMQIAQLKAETSAKFPFSTRKIQALTYAENGKPAMIPGMASVPGVIAFPGGIPVMFKSQQIGGIGASGGLPDQDEACAQAGLDTAAQALK